MADYTTAVGGPVNQITMTTSGAVTGGDPLEVSATNTVAKCAGATSVKYVGIAAHDAASGAKVLVLTPGPVFDGVADGAITAGDQLVPSAVATKQVKSAGAITTPTAAEVTATRAIIGVALTTAADAATVRWLQR
jgi:hypothetical protein